LSKKGSAPQVPGASAIFNKEGLYYGTLGGGILEAEIEKKALTALNDNYNQIVSFDLDADIHDEVGAICGGYASILIDSQPANHIKEFEKLIFSLQAGIPGVLVTIIEQQDDRKKINRFWIAQDQKHDQSGLYKQNTHLENNILKAISNNSPFLKEDEKTGHIIFYQPVYPDPHLIIVGAGHIGKALSHLGKLLDFRVTVIDDRPEHANNENIPDADNILSNDVEKDIQKINITDNTYIVIVTQGHKKDAIALKNCIHSNAAYIGMIGSKRKTRLMKEDFITRKWASKKDLDKIYAPIGIDIQSKTVQEIAISIAGQLVQKRQEKIALERGRDVEIIILAAGKSERMGQQKLIMPFAEKTIIEHIVDKALRSNAGEVRVIVGSHQDEVSNKILHLPVKITYNDRYEEGMLSSVQCGFNAMSSTSKAGMILLGDQPMVKISVINKLIESFFKTRKGIVIPVNNGKRGHPVLIDSVYITEINNLDPDIGLRQLMEERSSDIYEVEVDSETILKDIDTIVDYNRELTYRR
jgi:xanthine dehydrogenase accessory factor